MPRVRARVIDGRPCLQVLDSSGSSVRMVWQPPEQGDPGRDAEVRDLFRELFLSGLQAPGKAGQGEPQ